MEKVYNLSDFNDSPTKRPNQHQHRKKIANPKRLNPQPEFRSTHSVEFKRFVIIINMQTNEIVFVEGVEEHLGFANDSLTIEKYQSLIRPLDRVWVLGNARAIRKLIFNNRRFTYLAGKSSYHFEFVMQTAFGNFVKLIHKAEVTHEDDKGKPLIERNEYVIIQEDFTEDYLPQKWAKLYINDRSLIEEELILRQTATNYIRKGLGISDREWDILKCLATLKPKSDKKKVTSEQIARNLRISLFTVNTHRRNIKTKTGKEAAAYVKYLQKENLL